MKVYYKIAYVISLCLLVISCTYDEYDTGITDYNIYIESITSYQNGSRADIIDKTSFGEGDTILFNSFGKHTNRDNRLSFNGSSWISDKLLRWNTESEDSLNYSAIYPATKNLRYSKDELYDGGALKDILFCKAQSKYKEPINLHMKHLFSLLKLDLKGITDYDIDSVSITVPVTVDSISISEGTIYIDSNQKKTATALVDSNRNCLFIIPSIDNLSLSISIKSSGKIIEKVIGNVDYKAGKVYSCNIISSNKLKGIKSAEDFIAFSNLINGNAYTSRTLDEFYNIENGKRVFSLSNDITFTEEQSQRLKVIGDSKTKFNDIFDGKGYSINNLDVYVSTRGKAIFGYVGETATIKNLSIINSYLTFSDNLEGSLLCYRNYGMIDNCSIDNCTMESPNDGGSSLVSLYLFGTIINTRVNNCTIKCGARSASGIFTKLLHGKIINSFAANNLVTYNSGDLGVFALTTFTGSRISNCYVRSSSKQTKTIYQLAYTISTNSVASNCFISGPFPAWYSTSTSNSYSIFDEYFKVKSNGNDVVTLLNQWIDNNQGLYPNFHFKRWQRYTDEIPAIHIQ
jgi:hypothetical protein